MVDYPRSIRNAQRSEILPSMFDPERDQVRKTYQLCRLAFAINAIAYVIFSFTSLLDLFSNFEPGLRMWVHEAPWYPWLNVPIVWCSLIGAILLWGRWDNPSWQRRSGLLLVMCLVDAGLWFVDSGEALGLHFGDVGHRWLRGHLAKHSAGPRSLCCRACLVITWPISASSMRANQTSRFDRWRPRVPWSGCFSFASRRIGELAGP